MNAPESGAPVSAELVLSHENALRNQPERLKEAVIAREIFGRETYDGNLDSLVRGAARRLREKLDECYDRADGLESVRIAMPKEANVPAFSLQSIAVTPPSPAARPGRKLGPTKVRHEEEYRRVLKKIGF